MSYFRVTMRTDSVGRKTLYYTDPANPKLVFVPVRTGSAVIATLPRPSTGQRKGKKKKSGQAKIFAFQNAPQSRPVDL